VTVATGDGVAASARSRSPGAGRALLQALYAVVLIALAAAALKGWRDHQHAIAHQAALEAEKSATEARIAALKLRIERLQHDPATLDRVAREELGLVKPSEVVIVLPETPAAPAPPAH
jgi:cell division protein FtsB